MTKVENLAHAFWILKSKGLTTQQKLLYTYFLTCPNFHHSCIFYLPISVIQRETELSEEEIRKDIAFLQEKGLIEYEDDILWIKAPHAFMTKKEIKEIAMHLLKLLQSDITNRYLDCYPFITRKVVITGSGKETKEKEKEKVEQKEKERESIYINYNYNNLIDDKLVSQLTDSKEEREREIDKVIDYLNEAAGKKFSKKNKSSRGFISARMREGYTLIDFMKVIDYKVSQWLGDRVMSQYLRPQTLFRPSNFESYLVEANMEIDRQYDEKE